MKSRFLIAAASLAVGLWTAGEATAEPALRVDISGDCKTLDGEGNKVRANSGEVIVTFSENDNATRKCKIKGVEPPPDGSAVRWDYANTGLYCFYYDVRGDLQLTSRWWVEVTPSGISTIVCQFPDFPGG